jgi:2-oxoacid:acceptor oxidoreductase gamma subunit (pyruvate/2-ketoisovalerate family)
MKEIRIHGRGGQGVVVMAEMLATSFVLEGKYGTSFPMFGSERRGGPVRAFARFDEKPILEKTHVYKPDCLIIFDYVLLNSAHSLNGLNSDAVIIINSKLPFQDRPNSFVRQVGLVDADKIAVKEIGRPIPNTCLLGAFAAATGWLKLESVLLCIDEYFSDERSIANKACATIGFNEVKIIQY